MLARFAEWADERGVNDPGLVDRRLVERFQRHLYYRRKRDGAPLSFASQYSHLVAVKAFFSWTCRAGLTTHNPASEIDMPKLDRHLPRTLLSPAEIEAVLAVPDLATPIGLRDRAMMELLWSTGMRRGEICPLRLADLDTEALTVTVRKSKSRRDRVVPVGERAMIWIDRYLADSRPVLMRRGEVPFLFVSQGGADLTPDHLTIRVGRAIKTATAKTGSCHAFRHAMATAMLSGGADVRFVQEILGHALLSTTAIYTHVSIDQLKAVHAACHPAASNTRHRSATSDTAALHDPLPVEEDHHDHPVYDRG
jgi:integrase/recombinase XerD